MKCEVPNCVDKHIITCTKKRVPRFLIFKDLRNGPLEIAPEVFPNLGGRGDEVPTVAKTCSSHHQQSGITTSYSRVPLTTGSVLQL